MKLAGKKITFTFTRSNPQSSRCILLLKQKLHGSPKLEFETKISVDIINKFKLSFSVSSNSYNNRNKNKITKIGFDKNSTFV